MLYHVTYSIWYYPQFHITAVGLGMYYPQIQGSACIVICTVLCYNVNSPPHSKQKVQECGHKLCHVCPAVSPRVITQMPNRFLLNLRYQTCTEISPHIPVLVKSDNSEHLTYKLTRMSLKPLSIIHCIFMSVKTASHKICRT
jgi:hypothetical protein